MFGEVGRFAVRRRWWIIALWIIVVVASVPLLPRLPSTLQAGGFSSDRTEAARARELLQRELDFSASSLLVIYQADTLNALNPRFQMAVARSLARVRHLPNVTDVVLPDPALGMISRDQSTAYAIVGLDLPSEEAQRIVPAFEDALLPQNEVSISVAGGPVSYRDIEVASQRDLRRAEVIAFPIALVALLLVFGSVVAAVIPLAVGGAGVLLVLGTLYLVAQATDISIFALNLATMLGLGLAVDYSLFITSRFREELQRGDANVDRAVERTIETAGRAVFFSGTTVLIGLSGLALFDFMFLRSVGIAGAIVVAWSTIAALTLLPALLSVIGSQIDRLAVLRRPAEETGASGFWARLARGVMNRPWFVLLPTLALLLALGSPFLRANISSPDATILPPSLPSRQAFDTLVGEFGAGEISPFFVVMEAEGGVMRPDRLAVIHELTTRLARDARVTRVRSITPAELSRPQAITVAMISLALQGAGIDNGASRLANDNVAVIMAYTNSLPNDAPSKTLLRQIREMAPPGFTLLVEGGTAEIVDAVSEMYAEFPRAIALVVMATYVVLLILFRSVLLPLKAIVMNALSILASYGALVWVFQEGHLSQFPGFARLGFVEASLPIIMFCVLFGLSMDYEVFLLSRVREEWERTGDNERAVALGLQRSGRIITSAALLVVVVTASFVTADVVLIKALGFGIALAVFLDATVVRALLVPATMTLLGDWNWWLPALLRRLVPTVSVDEPL